MRIWHLESFKAPRERHANLETQVSAKALNVIKRSLAFTDFPDVPCSGSQFYLHEIWVCSCPLVEFYQISKWHTFFVIYFAFDHCFLFCFLAKCIFCWKEKDLQIQRSSLSGNPIRSSILSRNILWSTMWNTSLRSELKKKKYSTVFSFVSFVRAAVWTLWCQLPETGNHHTNCFRPSGCSTKVFSVIWEKNAKLHQGQKIFS